MGYDQRRHFRLELLGSRRYAAKTLSPTGAMTMSLGRAEPDERESLKSGFEAESSG